MIEVTTTTDEMLTDGQCSLREAIQAINTGASVDACILTGNPFIHVPAGVYTLSIAGASEDANASGDFDLLANMTLIGDGAAQTVIDGSQFDRVLQIHPGATVVISGVTIRNGRAPDGGSFDTYGEDGQDGGGIYNAGSLTLQTSVVSGSRTGDGGSGQETDPRGLGQGGNGGNGGGIFNSGTLALQHSTLQNNSCGTGGTGGLLSSTTPIGGNGGGVYSTGALVVEDSTVWGNYAGVGGFWRGAPGEAVGDGGSGGGIYISGSLALRGSTLAYNIAGSAPEDYGSHSGPGTGGRGGGLFSSGTAVLSNNTITANRGGRGGDGVYSGDGGDGGGIFNSGSMNADNLTINANLAGEAGDFLVTKGHDGAGGGIATKGSILLRNSILANNISAYEGADCTAGIESRGYNLVQQADGCGFTGDLTGNKIGVDPLLVNLSSSDSPTPVMLFWPVSPAIDAGSCADIKGNPILLDQRGVSRPQGAGCDIGAVEERIRQAFLPWVKKTEFASALILSIR